MSVKTETIEELILSLERELELNGHELQQIFVKQRIRLASKNNPTLANNLSVAYDRVYAAYIAKIELHSKPLPPIPAKRTTTATTTNNGTSTTTSGNTDNKRVTKSKEEEKKKADAAAAEAKRKNEAAKRETKADFDAEAAGLEAALKLHYELNKPSNTASTRPSENKTKADSDVTSDSALAIFLSETPHATPEQIKQFLAAQAKPPVLHSYQNGNHLNHETKHDNSGDNDQAIALTMMELMGSAVPAVTQADLIDMKNAAELRKKVSPTEMTTIEQNLMKLLKEEAIAGEKSLTHGQPDAHIRTTTQIKNGIPILEKIDATFKLSLVDNLTPDQVKAQVLKFLSDTKINQESSKISVAAIEKTIKLVNEGSEIDTKETQANVRKLLSRVCSLAKRTKFDHQTSFASCLSVNITDQGGCLPGLVARLYPLYAKMICFMLNVGADHARKPTVSNPAPKRPS